MSATTGTVPPPVSWAQRNDLIYVIIDAECKDIEHKVTENSLYFKGVDAFENKKAYEVTLNFLHSVNPEKVTSKNIGRCLEFTIYKKESGPYWSSLTNDKTKLHFLKANFNKWINESDGEDELDDSKGNFLDSMDMDNWNNKMDDFNVGDDDSDDNIPSLTQNDEDDDENEEKKEDEK